MRNTLRILGALFLLALVVTAASEGGALIAVALVAYLTGAAVLVGLGVVTARKIWRS